MRFHSVVFFLFFGVVLLLRHVLPWRVGRLVLLAASYTFYGVANPWYCLLLFSSTAVDFVVAQRIQASDDARRRKRLLLVSLVVNLGLLGVFKYADFGIANLNVLFGWLGAEPLQSLGWLLPVGISFYTFQTLSYTIDVYRRHTEPTRDFAGFALYVSYFPQLVAGPIERAHRLLPQLLTKATPSTADVELGFQRVLWGLTKKLVLADRLGLMVAPVYASAADQPAPVLIVATLCFSFQLYLDFSAYTDIAIGLARMMGVTLCENFRWPFLARNPSDFWNRWHMTLTQWFRDYVYLSLGGTRRRAPVLTLLHLTLVMTLVGLWHGAAWNFVAFGVLSGLELAGYTVLRTAPWRRSRGPLFGNRWWSTPLAVLCAFFTINMTMVFFASDSLGMAFDVIGGMFTHAWQWQSVYDVHLKLVLLLAAVHLWRGVYYETRAERPLPAPVRGAFWVAMIAAITWGTPQAAQPFIYFQF
jgi:D-alanyl-lipoteichoic acid acyltransferase DltB (MBOAT superfamily)